jgi:hypothetical protein
MFASTAIASTTSGVLTQTIAISPTVVSYAEWPALSALFDECKLVRSACTLRPLAGSNGQNMSLTTVAILQTNDVIMGPNHNNISTAPASYAAVARLADSEHVARTVGDRGAESIYLWPHPELDWATTLVPTVASPPAGVLGSFDISSAAGVSGAQTYYNVVLRTSVVFRNRA